MYNVYIPHLRKMLKKYLDQLTKYMGAQNSQENGSGDEFISCDGVYLRGEEQHESEQRRGREEEITATNELATASPSPDPGAQSSTTIPTCTPTGSNTADRLDPPVLGEEPTSHPDVPTGRRYPIRSTRNPNPNYKT